nr:putative potassium channel protein [Megavirus caiporensis]
MSYDIHKCIRECSNQITLPKRKARVLELIIILTIILVIIIIFGYLGYRYLFNMTRVDALYNTTLTISTLGIAPGDKTEAEKIFTGIYAVLVGVFFISLVSAIVSYIFSIYIIGQ